MRLGSDPEVFLVNKNTAKFTAICGMIGADKWSPKQIENLPAGFTLQEDNVALEFGIPPAASKDEFVFNIQKVLEAGLDATGNQYLFSNISAVELDDDQL